MIFYGLLALIILLGIVGAICCIEKREVVEGGDLKAEDFEIIEIA